MFPEESLRNVGHLNAKYHFGDYGSYNEMLQYMRTIEFYYPNLTKLVRIGESHHGVPIEGLKVSIYKEMIFELKLSKKWFGVFVNRMFVPLQKLINLI